MQQLFCLTPEIVKNIDTIDTNLSNLHALFLAPAQEGGVKRVSNIDEFATALVRYKPLDKVTLYAELSSAVAHYKWH